VKELTLKKKGYCKLKFKNLELKNSHSCKL